LAEQQSTQTNASDPGIRPEALDHLDECLAKLPERQRVAVSMQFLADRSADEVATALGVSRDNAYQLVSRGLATLRSLLSQRGIALSAPALLTLLASEGNAATSVGASATTSIALSLSATPSATAVNLATGVTTAMTLAAPTTITLMAGSLLLAVGVTSAVITAEPAVPQAPTPVEPIPTPSVLDNAPQTPAPVQPIPAPSVFDHRMDQLITVDFKDNSLPDCIDLMRKVSGLNFIIDPQLQNATTPLVTLRVQRMTLRHVLAHIGRLTGTTCVQRDTAYVIQADSAVMMTTLAAPFDFTSADARMRTELERRVTFDFVDTPLTDVISFLGQISSANMVVMPAVSSANSSVTLKVRDMSLQDAIKWLGEMTNTSVRYADLALVFDVMP
jgi:hypothetical protein